MHIIMSDGSWNSKSTQILNVVYCMWWILLILIIVSIYGWKKSIINTRIIIGFIIGIVYFFLAEGGKKGESFSNKCWKRKQNDFLRHNKVYLFVIILFYIDYKYPCSMLKYATELLLGAWIGLHASQT